MIDVKKLITGFLILATAAVCSGLIFSFVANSSGISAAAQTPGGPQIGAAPLNSSSSPIGANAFVDTGTLQGNAAEVLNAVDTSSTQAAAQDPSNITNDFADSFLNGLVAANPYGAAMTASGTTAFNAPNIQSVADQIASDPAVQGFKAPNWNVEVDEQPIKTIKNASPSDIAQYTDSLNAIFNKYFISTELENLLNNTQATDPTTLAYINTQVQDALSDVLALNVPSSLVPFQKSLVQVLVYDKDSSGLTQLASTDPIKASLILENEQTAYTTAITNLQGQMQSASAVGLLFGTSTPATSMPFIAQLLGIQPAHALFGFEITFDPSVFGRLILDYVNDTILQILKNTLVSLIQRKVLTWIQGSGAPRFVTNYASQLVNSFQTAAINTLNSDIACVPVYQQQVLKIVLSTPSVSNNTQSACAAEFNGQLNNNLTNYANLYNNFSNFNDYFAILGPTGNFWSNAIAIQDSAIAAGNTAQTANTTQNIAQQGFNGSQACGDGSNPNGTHPYCGNGASLVYDSNGLAGDPPTGCSDGSPVLIAPNGGLCFDVGSNIGTQPTITSPGQVTGQSMFTALQSSVSNITSADNIAGILNGLLSSLLNTLAQNAISAASGAINGVLTPDSGVTGITPSSLTTAQASTTATAVQCLPSIQTALFSSSTNSAVASVSAGGGAIDSTCAANNNCPASENPDGSPIYDWSAPGSVEDIAAASSGIPIAGMDITLTYTTPGQYFAVVTGSTDNTTSSCEIDVQ